MIYLDHSATTPVDPRVTEAMLPWFTTHFGNPSSIHEVGRTARVAVDEARQEIAHAICAHPAELIFTSGGTESNNAVIHGAIVRSQIAHSVYCGATEHHAVLDPVHWMMGQGAQAGILPVTESGELVWDEVALHNAPDTLLSVMHVNNETGCIHNIAKVRQHAPDAVIHTDAVQSLGKLPIAMAELGADFASFSAHKINGPKGIGALFIRKGIDFKAYQQGGGQERNRRSGTEAVALIVGFSHAVRYAMNEFEQRTGKLRELNSHLRDLISAVIPQARINSSSAGAPHIVNISFPEMDATHGESLIQMMDIHGIAVSSGSACVSGSQQPSHVLLAMGRSRNEASATVRFSLSHLTTVRELDDAVAILNRVIRDMCANT